MSAASTLTAAASYVNRNTPPGTVQFLGKVIGFVILFFLIRSQARKNIAREEYEKIVAGYGNPASVAAAYYQAMRPWGFNLLGMDGGTDEYTLYQLAAVSGNIWNEIQASYRTLYRRELIQDLQDELSPADFQRFLSILQGISQPPAPTQPGQPGTTVGQYVTTIRSTNLLDANDSTRVATTLPAGTRLELLQYVVTTGGNAPGTRYALVIFTNWIGYPTRGYVLAADVRAS